jgi:hypothetical protein
MEGVTVAPLKCGNCGAPVPVGGDDIDVIACRACKTECRLPAEVAKLRGAAQTEAKARDEAQRLADDLNAPPTKFRVFWSTASGIAFIAITITLIVWLGIAVVMCVPMIWKEGLTAALVTLVAGVFLSVPLVYNEILRDLAPSLGADYADVLSNALANALLGLGFYLLLALPVILGEYANGFDGARDILRGILGAKPPSTQGGPAECRFCGGALEIRPGTTHARCIYCSTDNLVDVPKDLSEKANEDAKTKHRDVHTAYEEAKDARIQGSKLALNRSWQWFLGIVGLFVLLGRIVAAINGNGDNEYYWTRAVPGTVVAHQSENVLPSEGVRGEYTSTKSFDRCLEECRAWFYVALDKGETITVQTEGPIETALETREMGPWYNPLYAWVAWDDAKGAPYKGYYRFTVIMPERSKGTPFLTWKRVRATR